MLLFGPSEHVLKAVKDCAVDLVLTDPPYGLSFMSKEWDSFERQNEIVSPQGAFEHKKGFRKLPRQNTVGLAEFFAPIWAECYRVLKPGGFILVMASPRNDDLVSVSLREAGFIKHYKIPYIGAVPEQIFWVYGQGFPKGPDVSKVIDARAVRDWLADKPHGLTHKEVNKVVSAAVNGEAMPETYRKSQGKKDPKARPHPITPEERKTGAALIASLEARFGAMPKRVKVGDKIRLGDSKAYPYVDEDTEYDTLGKQYAGIRSETAPATPLAAEWEGFKYGIQAIKPAAEVILVFQKPFDGKPVDSIVRHGVGAVNVDAGRVGVSNRDKKSVEKSTRGPIAGKGYVGDFGFKANCEPIEYNPQGRYPSNFIISHAPGCEVVGRRRVKSHNPENKDDQVGFNPRGNKLYGKGSGVKELPGYADDDGRETVKEWACVKGCAVAELDRQSGIRPSGSGIKSPMDTQRYGSATTWSVSNTKGDGQSGIGGDTGTASRFFYQPEWSSADDVTPFIYKAKASSRERNAGVYAEGALCYVLKMRAELGLDAVKLGHVKITPEVYKKRKGKVPKWIKKGSHLIYVANRHPTVKPVELMKYLIEIFIGKGRVVLDPFVGSGTTLIAGLLAGLKVIGVDADWGYCQISAGREKYWTANLSTYLTTGQIPVVKDAELPLFDNGSNE